MQYQSAREFFDAARAAARESRAIRLQLAAMEQQAVAIGSGGFESRVHSTPNPDRMAARVAALADRRAVLEQRQAECDALVDAACRVLYGTDDGRGLYALVPSPAADAIWHHYLALRTWDETAHLVAYSKQHVRRMVAAAFDLADANGQMWTELGRGFAQQE